jgi:hypothetical protein
MDRAIRLAEQVLGRLAGRIRLLRLAAGLRGTRPDEARLALVRLPDADRALIRAIAARCQASREAAMRVQLVLDQFAEASQYLDACRGGMGPRRGVPINPAVLRVKVAPLLRLHEAFGQDPVLERLVSPAERPPPAPTRPLQPPRVTGNLARAFPGSAFDPGLGERIGRAVSLAESFVNRHGPAVRLVRSAVRLRARGTCEDFPALAPPAQQLVRRLAEMADAETAKRMAVAVEQFQQACDAIFAARSALDRARTGGPAGARALAEIRPERVKGVVMPLSNFPLTFKGHPILGRLFPDRVSGDGQSRSSVG